MASIKQAYGTADVGITITLASLANSSMRQSAYVDNTTDLFLNVLVSASLILGASGVSSTGVINIYAYGTATSGSSYTSGASGSNAAYTGEKLNLILVASLDANTNGETVNTTFDIASAFGGVVPARWGLIVENLSGTALSSGVSELRYQGVYGQV